MRELLKNKSPSLCFQLIPADIFPWTILSTWKPPLVPGKPKPSRTLQRWFFFSFFICLQITSVETGIVLFTLLHSFGMARRWRRSRELLRGRCVSGRSAPYLRPHRIHPAVCAIDPSSEPSCWRPHSFCLAERDEGPSKASPPRSAPVLMLKCWMRINTGYLEICCEHVDVTEDVSFSFEEPLGPTWRKIWSSFAPVFNLFLLPRMKQMLVSCDAF